MTNRPVLKLVSYDTAKYAFARVLAQDVFRVGDLSRYHEPLLQEKRERGDEEPFTFGDNMAARERFKCMSRESRFYKLHHAFMWNVVAPLFHYRLRHTMPYFRVQLGHSSSVSLWHRDVDVTGNGNLVTAWIPVVDASGSNTVWIEREYGTRDYAPVPVRYGEILFFDSAYLWHGSVPNDSDVTRVSMDIRITPMKTDVDEPDLGILAARPAWCLETAVDRGAWPESAY